MPSNTYAQLATITLSSSAASVTFSSISQDYKDLILVSSGTGTGNINLCARLNNDSGSNYNSVYTYGTGSGSVSGSASSQNKMDISAAAYWGTSGATTTIFQLFNYSTTNQHKASLSRSNNTGVAVDMQMGRWASTAAVTSLVIIPSNANSFAAGSIFTLYGIAG